MLATCNPKLIRILFLLCMAACLPASCVYFNTFYNGKAAFNQARDSQQKRMEAVSVDSVEAVNSTERGLYDRAIAKASKVLEAYPHKKKWTDDAIFLIGESYFYMEEYSKAVRKFQELLSNYPQSPFGPEAQVLLGRSYLGKGDFEMALAAFDEFEKKYPKASQGEDLSIYRAQTLAQMGTKRTAISQLNNVLSSAPSRKADRIRFQLGRLHFESEHYDECCKLFGAIQDKHLSTKESYEKGILYSRALRRTGKAEPALRVLEKMEKDDRHYAHLTEIWVEQAAALEALGRYGPARDKLRKAADRQDDAAPKAAFALAEILRLRFGQLDSARKSYDKAVGSRDADTRNAAQERIKSISRIAQYQKLLADSFSAPHPPADTLGTRAQLKYQVGEVYWFQLNMADSARQWFQRVMTDSAGDSVFVPKAALGLAVLTRDELHDTLKGDSLLRSLLQRFPNTAEAKAARKQLGMEVTLATREDSAHNGYLEAEELLWKKEEAAKAAARFDTLSDRYGDTPYGPQAGYISAWIHDQVLFDSAGAAVRYENVYRKWKDTEQGRSASRKLKALLGGSEATPVKDSPAPPKTAPDEPAPTGPVQSEPMHEPNHMDEPQPSVNPDLPQDQQRRTPPYE